MNCLNLHWFWWLNYPKLAKWTPSKPETILRKQSYCFYYYLLHNFQQRISSNSNIYQNQTPIICVKDKSETWYWFTVYTVYRWCRAPWLLVELSKKGGYLWQRANSIFLLLSSGYKTSKPNLLIHSSVPLHSLLRPQLLMPVMKILLSSHLSRRWVCQQCCWSYLIQPSLL